MIPNLEAIADFEGQELGPSEWVPVSQERIEAVLFNLGAAELRAILEEDGRAEVSCHFCNIAYGVEGSRIAELIALHGG